jgi:hypothetical protein
MIEPVLTTEFDYKEARKELRKERRDDYEKYLRTYHHDLIPLLSTPALHSSQSRRHFIRRSPSLHRPMLQQFSFEQFPDQREEFEEVVIHCMI